MISADLDSGEDAAASAPNDAEREEQVEVEVEVDDDSPAESDVLEEVGVDLAVLHYLNNFDLKKTWKWIIWE